MSASRWTPCRYKYSVYIFPSEFFIPNYFFCFFMFFYFYPIQKTCFSNYVCKLTWINYSCRNDPYYITNKNDYIKKAKTNKWYKYRGKNFLDLWTRLDLNASWNCSCTLRQIEIGIFGIRYRLDIQYPAKYVSGPTLIEICSESISL